MKRPWLLLLVLPGCVQPLPQAAGQGPTACTQQSCVAEQLRPNDSSLGWYQNDFDPQPEPRCTLEGDSVLLSFQNRKYRTRDGKLESGFVSCTFLRPEETDMTPPRRGADLSRFDLEAGNAGVVAVEILVRDVLPEGASLFGTISVWYGKHPLRKQLVVLPQAGRAARGSTLRARFVPGAAQPTDELRNVGKQDFSNTELSLIHERTENAVEGTLELRLLRYFPERCACQDNEGCCGATPACDRSVGQVGLCQADCQQLAGRPCLALVAGQEHRGTFLCEDGEPVCQAP